MDAAIVVFTGIVALSTVFYAVVTLRLVSETRRMREVQTEPRESVRAELTTLGGQDGMNLVIQNDGQGPAENIHSSFKAIQPTLARNVL
jgi:hypothetical protein